MVVNPEPLEVNQSGAWIVGEDRSIVAFVPDPLSVNDMARFWRMLLEITQSPGPMVIVSPFPTAEAIALDMLKKSHVTFSSADRSGTPNIRNARGMIDFKNLIKSRL